MAYVLEKRLENLICDVYAMQKELIIGRTLKRRRPNQRLLQWEALSAKVSSQWDSVSAIDEIAAQREKTW